MVSKMEEENKINFNILNLEFGKCIFTEQFEKIKNILENLDIPFGHPPDCPFEKKILKEMTYSELEKENLEKIYQEMIKVKNKQIKFASVGILKDKEGKVLLTRRNEKLLSFPKAWVFPGGKLDENENFMGALKREILEETGINIDELQKDNIVCIKPILLYESSFPQQMPTSQILVVFFVVEINKSKDDLKLQIEVNEVDAYAWVDLDLLKFILFTREERIYFEFKGSCFDPAKKDFINRIFNQHNFHVKETGEYIPYGHFLACKYI